MLSSSVFLQKCIDINKGMQNTAERMLSAKHVKGKKILEGLKILSLDEMLKEDIQDESGEEWLQINDEKRKHVVDKRKYINRFSEWEKILFLLVEKDRSFYSEQSMEERIKTAILGGEKIFQNTSIEEDDAAAHDWEKDSYKKVREYQGKLKISGESFCGIYEVLSEYRDLFKVQIETSEERKENSFSHIGEGSKELTKLFYIFLIYLWVNIFRMLPKITVFFPAGRFLYMNFYNTRFEDSAFRASSFKNGIFSRSKVDNSNFGMALFRNCEFFSIDSRNCSFSNTLLQNCGLKEAIFKNVDFTGAVFKNCELEKAVFNDSILSNLTIVNSTFGQNEVVNSKIGNVTFSIDLKDEEEFFDKCNFSDSILFDIRFQIGKQLVLPLAEKEKSDSIIQQYLKILGNKEIDQYFWGDRRGADISAVETIIEQFVLNNDLFYKLRVIGERKKKKEEQVKGIWEWISCEAAINMNESGFTNAVMPGIEFYRVKMEQSVFSNAQMESVKFISVYMPGCIMNSTNMREGLLWAVNMRSAVLNDAIFFKAKCKLVNIEDASLRNLHASETQITYCSFNRSDCSNIDLTRAVLKESSFIDTILKEAEFTNARFYRISFENSIADSMLSSYSVFDECIMKNAFLQQSSFNYSVFSNCDFSFSNFANSAVTNVEFYHCDFKESNFRNTCFINAYFEDNYHIKPEIFADCKFINPQFKGRNAVLEKWLKIE